MDKLERTRRILNRAAEPFRRDEAEPNDDLDAVEREALLDHVDADDEDMT